MTTAATVPSRACYCFASGAAVPAVATMTAFGFGGVAALAAVAAVASGGSEPFDTGIAVLAGVAVEAAGSTSAGGGAARGTIGPIGAISACDSGAGFESESISSAASIATAPVLDISITEQGRCFGGSQSAATGPAVTTEEPDCSIGRDRADGPSRDHAAAIARVGTRACIAPGSADNVRSDEDQGCVDLDVPAVGPFFCGPTAVRPVARGERATDLDPSRGHNSDRKSVAEQRALVGVGGACDQRAFDNDRPLGFDGDITRDRLDLVGTDPQRFDADQTRDGGELSRRRSRVGRKTGWGGLASGHRRHARSNCGQNNDRTC